MKLIAVGKRMLLILMILALAGVVGCGDVDEAAAPDVSPAPDISAAADVPLAADVRPAEGVSVVYEVEYPEGGDPARLLQQTIDALKARAKSSGKTWHIVSTGWNELEIVTPAPYEDQTAIDAAVASVRSIVESGTLSFHIAPQPAGAADDAALPQDEQHRLRDTFREDGIQAVGQWRWVVLKDPESVAGSPDVSLATLDAEGVSGLFAKPAELIVERRDGRYYVLLGDSPETAMTKAQDWTIESAQQHVDTRNGRPMVKLRLDEAGGALLKRLTKANIRRKMAVVVSGEVLMIPIIQEALGQDVAVSGGIDGFSASKIADMVSAFTRKPLPVHVNVPPMAVSKFSWPQKSNTP
jgi:hypothetical protein